MNNVQIRWIVVGSLALALGGCEVHKCTDKDEDGRCADLFDDDEDAGDDDAGPLDGGRSDGGRSDGGRTDGGTDGGTGEGGADGGGGEALTLEQFCEAQFATAISWRTAIGEYCDDDSFPELESFLESTFLFPKDDAVGKCISALNSNNLTFDGSRAAACAEAFASQYDDPPASFSDGGIDLSMYTSTIGHGAAALAQLPECRAAFKGKLARDARCLNHLECMDGLRCLPAPGDTIACQPALTGGVCLSNAQCDDGYTCVGTDASGGKTCVTNDALPLAGNCGRTLECAEGRVCNDSNRCVAPTADVICAP
jgi:hypothetical protein